LCKEIKNEGRMKGGSSRYLKIKKGGVGWERRRDGVRVFL